MSKLANFREILRSIFGPLFLLIVVFLAYVALIYGFTAFEYNTEWKVEQETFETAMANTEYEQERLANSASAAQDYSGKYTLAESDVYAIVSGFLNKTLLTTPTYTFLWVKSLTFHRMYQHALMLDDNKTLIFNKPSTKIVDIVFRSVLPIFATFAIGNGASALHTITTSVIRIFIRHKKYDAWTVGRNRMLRFNVMATMIVAIVYFVFSFVFVSYSASRWLESSWADGIKVVLNLIATIPPNVKVTTITDAHTLCAYFFLINTSVAYVVLSLIQLIKTWRISAFAIPLIADIDAANQVDKDVQVEYRKKKQEMFEKAK